MPHDVGRGAVRMLNLIANPRGFAEPELSGMVGIPVKSEKRTVTLLVIFCR